MKPLISKQAIQYLYQEFVNESVHQKLPIQEKLSEKQLESIYDLTLRAVNSVFGIKKYPGIIEQTAFIIYNLNKLHLLEDGNKRFSLILAVYLLDNAGINYQNIPKNDWEMLIMRVASDPAYTLQECINYLKEKLNN